MCVQVRTASCSAANCVNTFGDEQLAVDLLADKLLFEALKFSVRAPCCSRPPSYCCICAACLCPGRPRYILHVKTLPCSLSARYTPMNCSCIWTLRHSEHCKERTGLHVLSGATGELLLQAPSWPSKLYGAACSTA
jgi:hypothetical protein